jgi:hypothetical protein
MQGKLATDSSFFQNDSSDHMCQECNLVCQRDFAELYLIWYTQISEQDKTQLTRNRTVNFYHRKSFLKSIL